MDRAALERLLDEAERARRRHIGRMKADQARAMLNRPWVDAPLVHRIGAMCERFGLKAVSAEQRVLRVGETYLLVAGAAGAGAALRLSINPAACEGRLQPFEVRGAQLGLRAASGKRGRRIEFLPGMEVLAIEGGQPHLTVLGRSSGLSIAVATLSKALRRAPRSDVAGTAQLGLEGELRAVEGVETKARALRAQWPQVTKLVVAAEQEAAEGLGDLELVRASTLEEACAVFGLSLDELPKCKVEDWQKRLDGLRKEDSKAHESSDWSALSAEALEVASALAERQPQQAAEANMLAGLFSSHAGDNEHAGRLLSRLDRSALEEQPKLEALWLIFHAASLIDSDPGAAASLAAEARAAWTSSPGVAVECLGRALGTEGRALMHAGRWAEAEGPLRHAVEEHRAHEPHEAPRSLCYLATCLRLLGRLDEAGAVLAEGLEVAEREAEHYEWAVTTRLYLWLERGRLRAAEGDWARARQDLEDVVAGQMSPSAYPRLGAHRSRFEIALAQSDHEQALADLTVCMAVARDRWEGASTLARVGAIAAGHALAAGWDGWPREELEAVWRSCFGAQRDRGRVLREWIY